MNKLIEFIFERGMWLRQGKQTNQPTFLSIWFMKRMNQMKKSVDLVGRAPQRKGKTSPREPNHFISFGAQPKKKWKWNGR